MSWVPTNKGQPHSTNYQDLTQPLYGVNEYDHHFPDINEFNLTFDPHNLNPNSYHFHDVLAQSTPQQEHNHITNNMNNNTSCLASSSEVPEIPNTCFNYITELLRDNNPTDETLGTLQEYMAYQSYYQSFTDTLSDSRSDPQSQPQPQHQHQHQPQHSSDQFAFSSSNRSSSYQFAQQAPQEHTSNIFSSSSSSHGSNSLGSTEDSLLESQSQSNLTDPSSSLQSSLSHFPLLQQALMPPNQATDLATPKFPNNSAIRARKHLHNEDGDEHRQSKQNLTASTDTYEQISEYEDNIFCPEGKLDQQKQIQIHKSKTKSKKNQTKGARRPKPEVVDTMSLLLNCAESVSRMDINAARDQLTLIRKHSSPYGDNLQRFAHYSVNALDQRLSSSSPLRRAPSATEFLRSSRIYVAAAPFNIMSYYVANKTMFGLGGNATRIHIIDFGIGYGLQWPCIIYNLSKVEPTPPRLRITGIDFPESGFRPEKRLEETGRCLRKYSERFKVEFEYKEIVAEKWENVTVEEIGVDRDEFTVVNSLYRSQELYDDSVEEESSPRDSFLEAVRRIKPDYFVHGVVNGNLNGPFFIMRFKEVVAHYAAFFEVFEATMPREDLDRVVLEGKVFGEALCNMVACEGRQRIERPETFRKWQARKARVGFRQVPLERELVKRAKAMVQRSFRKEFMMEEDCGWVVQGWKGRILYAISCWRPQD